MQMHLPRRGRGGRCSETPQNNFLEMTSASLLTPNSVTYAPKIDDRFPSLPQWDRPISDVTMHRCLHFMLHTRCCWCPPAEVVVLMIV